MIRRWLFGARGGRSNTVRRERKKFFCRLKVETLEDRRLLAIADGNTADDNPQLVVDSSQSPTSLLVQFKPGANFASSLSAYSYGGNLGESWDIAPDLRQVYLNSGTDVEAALAAYANDANVVHVEPNYRVKLTDFSSSDFDTPPRDPYFNEQWDLQNTGQQGGYVGSDIHLPDAWKGLQDQLQNQQAELAPVVVAVIDTGVDYNHPDLAAHMWTNSGEIPNNHKDDDGDGFVDDYYGYNFVSNNGNPMDDFFHGTHVAGTIAAVANNDIGITGIAPNVQIMALKFLDDQGGGLEADAIRALNFAVNHGASISNNSWGGLPFSSAFQSALSNAAQHGHIFVAAAGNNGMNNDFNAFYPATYSNNNVVSVAATDAGDALASFSNFGKTTVDIGAPGVNIFSTLPLNETPGMQDAGLIPEYGTLNGTSMAAPHVAGVLALVRGLHPDWTMTEVIDQVLNSAEPVSSLASQVKTGGRLDVATALGFVPTDSIAPHFVSGDPSGVTHGPVDHVRVKFSEPINEATFDVSDIVSFYGPDGQIFPTGVSSVNGDDTRFDISFDPVSTPGDYSLELGPHITDLAGIEIDQNGDSIPGIDGAPGVGDDYLVSFSIPDSSNGTGQFVSADVPLPITNTSVFTSTLTIDQDFPIADVNVYLDLTYPRDGNLKIWLVSPSGTSVTLSQRRGGNLADGSSANFTNTVFDDQASTSIVDGTAPFTGTFQPDTSPVGNALSLFNDENAYGTWQLKIQNKTSTVRQGTLNSWSLDITPNTSSTCDNGGCVDPPQDDPPQPQDDFITATQGDAVVISFAELLSNDTDPNGDLLSVVSADNPVGGNVVMNFDNTITFYSQFGGLTPGSFDYSVFDGYLISTATVHITFQPYFDYHNYNDPNDVDGDGFVSASDVIAVINFINANPTSRDLAGRKVYPASAPSGYLDVVADNEVATNDVFSVINYINAHPLHTSVSSQSAAPDSTLNPAAVDAYLLSSTLDSNLSSKKK